MNNECQGYLELNQNCATDFLQHVVIVDNRLYFTKKEENQFHTALTTPVPRQRRKNQESSDQGNGNENEETVSHDLNAKKLVESFADKGIICCPYLPSDTEEDTILVDRAFKIARNADIVVLDWKLGGPSTKVINIIKEILKHDKENGGRLRLITIYTGEEDVVTHYRELMGEIFPEDEPHDPEKYTSENIPSDYYTIDKEKLKIIFINKELVENPQAGVSVIKEEHLPDFLIDKFAEMTEGLMSNIALSSITAVREATHHMLAKYDNSLDPAILSHRALITLPEDAEDFALSLISDEIKSILEVLEVGREELGIDKIELWLNYQNSKGLNFDLDSPNGDELDVSKIKELLETGSVNGDFHELWEKKDGSKYRKNQFKKDIPNLFSKTDDEVKNSNLRLSRYSNLKREANESYYKIDNWFPILKLGSIIYLKNNEEYLLCIQPVCDSVRLPFGEKRKFPFLILEKKSYDDRFDLVVKTDNGDECFKIKHDPYEHVHYEFSPIEDNGVIKAIKVDGHFYFRLKKGSREKFKWISDVKELYAQREVQTSSTKLGRVGLDEYEWLLSKK